MPKTDNDKKIHVLNELNHQLTLLPTIFDSNETFLIELENFQKSVNYEIELYKKGMQL